MTSRTIAILFLSFSIFVSSGCSDIWIRKVSSKSSQYSENDNFAGWGYVASKLIDDGIPKKLVKSVYNGVVVPHFDFVSFQLSPKETHDMYSGYRTKKIKNLAKQCYYQYQNYFDRAEKIFKVPSSVIVAILMVETRCGKSFGNSLIVNRLSRVVSVGEPENLLKNYEILKKDSATVSKEEVKLRAEYLDSVFYPQLLALFQAHLQGKLDIYTLKGSIAGAFGWPQFLPKTYLAYGIDADNDGKVDIFSASDAIYSVANFLKNEGWQENLTEQEIRNVIWHYNRSEPYIDTVIYLSSN